MEPKLFRAKTQQIQSPLNTKQIQSSIMPTVIPFDRNGNVSIMVALKPKGPSVDNLVETLVCFTNWFENSGYLHSAFILRSIHGNLVIWCGIWSNFDRKNDPNLSTAMEACESMLSELANITGPISYNTYCGENKSGVPFATVSRGDIVTIRKVVTESEKQESLCYASMAILKSYFGKTKGLSSYTCFRSLDGDKVVGLGVWKELEHAYAWILGSGHPYSEKSMEGYVAELVLSTNYDVMEVVYATGDEPHPPVISFLSNSP